MSETIRRGHGEIKLSWKKGDVKREATLHGDFTEGEMISVFADLLSSNLPDDWLEGYAAGRRKGVNAPHLEYAQKQKDGKK